MKLDKSAGNVAEVMCALAMNLSNHTQPYKSNYLRDTKKKEGKIK